MRKVSIADVADHASVSKSTVSQYLNGRYNYMGADTKERIEQAIKELNYYPNHLARSLKQKRTSTIGVIVANILHTFSTQVIRAIEDVCNEQDINVIVCNADDHPLKEKKYIDMLRAKQVDGLITFPTGGNVDLYQQMADERYPLIFIDRIVNGISVDSFLLDNESAVKLAVDHFVQKGHRQIGMLTTSLIRNVTPRIERVEGFKKALRAYNISPNLDYIKGLKQREIQDSLHKMLSLDNPPSALLAGNDLTLMEVLSYVKKMNIKVPDDLALISIDDVSFAHIYNPTLTAIAQPSFEIGEEAANLLIRKVMNPDIEEKNKVHRFNPDLIERNSN